MTALTPATPACRGGLAGERTITPGRTHLPPERGTPALNQVLRQRWRLIRTRAAPACMSHIHTRTHELHACVRQVCATCG